MELKVTATRITEADADALLVFAVESGETTGHELTLLDAALNGAIQSLVNTGDFSGKNGQVAVLYPRDGFIAKRVILVGLGRQETLTLDTARRAAALGIRRARDLKIKRVAALPADSTASGLSVTDAVWALSEGVMLGAYKYQGQKTIDVQEALPEAVDILLPAESDREAVEAGLKIGVAFASGAVTARDLINLPPNICTPIYIASNARNMAERVGLKITVLDRDQMDELRMGALLAVAQGSSNPPRFIILEHNADRASELDTLVLVGKGVTFDTGGYSIKTAEGMVGMKADMSGAAAVIGAMQTIAMLNVPLHVVGLAPASENLISSTAYRPQDVITASNGKTIEIISTDAEGRLLLADALVYAKRYEPQAVVDIATLTGACAVALGSAAAGFFCTDSTLRDRLVQAGTATGERVWELPLFPEYKKAIESDTADMKNTGGRTGGVGTSAVFLQQFVDYPAWAHIDMAGVMADLADIPYMPAKGGSAFGTRLLAEFVRQWSERK